MARCKYGYWLDGTRKRQCYDPARFLVRAHQGRELCSHHAAIAQALGWTVTALDKNYPYPQFEEKDYDRLD